MSVEVKMPGSPESIRAVADWLDSLKSSMSDTDIELSSIWSDSNSYWTGESGTAWRSTVGALRSRAMGVPGYLGDAVGVFRAYANRIQRSQEDLATLLFQAGEVGLPVSGQTVYPPTTRLSACPTTESSAADIAEYDDYTDKLASYSDLQSQVGRIMGELDAWVGEHIVPLVQRVEEFKDLSGTVNALQAPGNSDIASEVLGGYNDFQEHKIGEWRAHHDELQDAADTFRNQLRSGNPALRAAAEAADPHAMRQGIEEIAEQIGRISKFTKVIPVAGAVLDVVSIAQSVQDGGSLTSELAALGGGAAGGAVAGGLLAGTPIGWAILGVGGAALVAGSGARWLWEAAVPFDTRETIDDFFLGSPPRLEGYVPPPPRSRPAPVG